MNLNLSVIQVTENIFKVENETLHLFFDRTELMAQQGGKTSTFFNWLQKFDWKNTNLHKRSKSEDTIIHIKEAQNNPETKLDIVLEEDFEQEEEPLKKQKTPIKAQASKTLKKSPSGKILRNYSPILSKKKAK